MSSSMGMLKFFETFLFEVNMLCYRSNPKLKQVNPDATEDRITPPVATYTNMPSAMDISGGSSKDSRG